MTTPQACHAALMGRLQRADALGYWTALHESGSGVYRDPKDGFISLRCLSDTIDPRGSKEGAR